MDTVRAQQAADLAAHDSRPGEAHTVPRLVIAAAASGHGKTTIATGLMAALGRAGHPVAPFKVGPDYIDPGYHALATGRPGRNLDVTLCGAEKITPLLLHGVRPGDLAVIEGVMGLFDGRLGTDGAGSTADVARLTSSPVVAVIDISHASRTVGAIVHGLAGYDPRIRLAGVILNKAASARHAAEAVAGIAPTGVPILGVLPRDAGIEAPSRHLGLVPAAERADAATGLDLLAARIAEHIDLEAVRRIAETAPSLSGAAWDPAQQVRPPSQARPVVAMAGGRAFTFRYAETEELLRAAGCTPVVFDPLNDEALPAETSGIYLGGGFPEMHAADLSANHLLRSAVAEAVRRGVPTVAECAGLLYLCRSIDQVEMTGVLELDAVMGPRLTMGYRRASAERETLLAAAGEQISGHEFHRTRIITPAAGDAAWRFDNGAEPPTLEGVSADPSGAGRPSVHASYLHTHWAGHPGLAQRFVDGVHRHAADVKDSHAS